MNARLAQIQVFGAALILTTAARGADSTDVGKDETWRKPDPAAMKRWQDMRFGMFIHWGPVSLTGHEIGWSRGNQTPIERYDALWATHPHGPPQLDPIAIPPAGTSEGLPWNIELAMRSYREQRVAVRHAAADQAACRLVPFRLPTGTSRHDDPDARPGARLGGRRRT
jgi:hypothetical protein